MYNASLEFQRRLQSGASPLFVLALNNGAGTRLYAQGAPAPDSFGWTEVHLADGSHRADGSNRAGQGSQAILARRADLKSGARLTETLTPQRSDLLTSLRGQEVGHMVVVLKNEPEDSGLRHFSKIAAVENILGALASIRAVFPDLTSETDALDRFSGRVLGFTLTREEMILELGAL